MITAQVNSPLRHRVCFDLSSDSGAHVLSFRESQVKHVAAPSLAEYKQAAANIAQKIKRAHPPKVVIILSTKPSSLGFELALLYGKAK